MPEHAIADMKAALRETAKARRAAIDHQLRAKHSAAAAARVIALLSTHPTARISAFLSIGEELDTAPAIAALAEAGHTVALPVMQGKARPLAFRQFRPGDALRTVQWGIREPQDASPLVEPDLLLVPLLAFDRTGNRLGYGGGYYDRTIRSLRQTRTVVAVGLAFDEQEVDAVPHLDYDERLDWVVTPTRTIECAPSVAR